MTPQQTAEKIVKSLPVDIGSLYPDQYKDCVTAIESELTKLANVQPQIFKLVDGLTVPWVKGEILSGHQVMVPKEHYYKLTKLQSRLDSAREVIESLVNIEGIAWMNHRTTDVALRKAREWLEKNKEE
jgi:hypothetical protein